MDEERITSPESMKYSPVGMEFARSMKKIQQWEATPRADPTRRKIEYNKLALVGVKTSYAVLKQKRVV
jgi:hypothetical protein